MERRHRSQTLAFSYLPTVARQGARSLARSFNCTAKPGCMQKPGESRSMRDRWVHPFPRDARCPCASLRGQLATAVILALSRPHHVGCPRRLRGPQQWLISSCLSRCTRRKHDTGLLSDPLLVISNMSADIRQPLYWPFVCHILAI